MSSSEPKNIIITIRVAEPSDSAAVAKLWVDGLSQTVDNSWRIFQPLVRYLMNQSAKEALSSNDGDSGGGDLGPDGIHLMKHWVEPPDRTFFVATINTKDDGRVVGCVGVKKKSNDDNDHDITKIVTDDTKVAAIFRMSVDENYRRMGIGQKLMKQAHEWAKVEANCESMWLPTINPRAAEFYKSLGYEPCHWSGMAFSKKL
eukprot:scaffold2004_cov101-Cylindrotheca_fusiformis.AAC.8